MDFKTIREKIKWDLKAKVSLAVVSRSRCRCVVVIFLRLQCDYIVFEDFAADVYLMCDNATKYNPPGTVVHELALVRAFSDVLPRVCLIVSRLPAS